MKAAALDNVRLEMQRFKEAVERLESEGTYVDPSGREAMRYYNPGRLTGAVRRASLDLTRALADLRRR